MKQTTRIPEMLNTSIHTMNGKARYICTEIEDSNGNFNDDYSTSDGYYLIHEAKHHHVYKV